MPGDDLIIAVNNNRVIETKLRDGCTDLPDLFGGMRARIARIRFEPGNPTPFNLGVARGSFCCSPKVPKASPPRVATGDTAKA
jgi:hypothetical protein